MSDLLDRLADKFLVGDGCWPWVAARTSRGYGSVRVGDRTQQAHRVLYELLVGPIPEGLQLDHLCRNRSCVRPDHLEPVTCGENIRRGTSGEATRAAFAARTHCAAGHPLTEENTYATGHAGGGCRTCKNARWNRMYWRRKETL